MRFSDVIYTKIQIAYHNLTLDCFSCIWIIQQDMIRNFLECNPKWLHPPKEFKIEADRVQITTEPGTDYWQKTYTSLQNDKAPILYIQLEEDFTFEVRNLFKFNKIYDHCGIILYQDSDNWFKLGSEHENEKISRLGSVVTNLGYSDWATTDIPASTNELYLRVSRRRQDFLIEYSFDGQEYHQMRLLHVHQKIEKARIGLFACSPTNSSFVAEFINPIIKQSMWQAFQMPN